jgi:hypothetical protein
MFVHTSYLFLFDFRGHHIQFHANQNLLICVKEMGIGDEELSRPNTAM